MNHILQAAASVAIAEKLTRKVLNYSIDKGTNLFRVQVSISKGEREELDYLFISNTFTDEMACMLAKAVATFNFMGMEVPAPESREVVVDETPEIKVEVVEKAVEAPKAEEKKEEKKPAKKVTKKAEAPKEVVEEVKDLPPAPEKLKKPDHVIYDREQKTHKTQLALILAQLDPKWREIKGIEKLSPSLVGEAILTKDGKILDSFVMKVSDMLLDLKSGAPADEDVI